MSWTLQIDHIAGILEGQAEIERGLNAVRAENWQGKSSLIMAIEAAMGTEKPLTENADEGEVVLESDDGEVAVSFTDQNGTIVRHGTPYLENEYDRTCAELYAFLDESNPIRRAVRNEENLEELLTKPLDLENIDNQIAELKAERDAVESELARAESAAEELIAAESELTTLQDELESLEARRAEVSQPESDGTGREELSNARTQRENLRSQIDRIESSIDRIEGRLEERRTEREELELPEVDGDAEDVQVLNETLQRLEADVELLRSVYTANKRIVDENRLELLADVERGLLEDSFDCWVCEGTTDEEAVQRSLEALQGRISELQDEASELRERVRTAEQAQKDRRRAKRRAETLESEIEDLETKLTDRRETLEQTRESLESTEVRIEKLQESVSETEDKVTELESEIKYTKSRISDAEGRIQTLEDRADQRPSLESERESLSEEITQLRSRRDEMKAKTRESFSESIAEIIDRFDTSYESARLTSNFDLVVARDGREVSLEALSEGEVVLLGIVAALAGYDAYDVDERVPVILIDSLGGLTDKNLNLLVEYLLERTERIVCTAYPEQSSVEGHEIDPASWTVVSDDSVTVQP
ncbi:archaea-specific SMC-related protein [Natrarchaeobius oligotrophus]|uniref:ATPase n=1 Tax=Natrarchaeobius chitinivorans TaxID=1679083 RepID=A0A3N6N3P7_NATCH|nr:archaea-specific SMC-related protein [Natrarchaeobius chitinivorans]RQH02297.1 ATPase [Natrarchaeobius chitinivorans]